MVHETTVYTQPALKNTCNSALQLGQAVGLTRSSSTASGALHLGHRPLIDTALAGSSCLCSDGPFIFRDLAQRSAYTRTRRRTVSQITRRRSRLAINPDI